MGLEYIDFVHPNHFDIFVAAAREFKCHILVRKTGRAAITWIGKRGYTGKRADLKAKTSNLNFGRFQTAGLVCSPLLMPQVFTGKRLFEARQEWAKCAHLITAPNDSRGFDDKRAIRGCRTPYLVQTNSDHIHYGCVALVEMGLLVPRYVHGDYDIYAIIPVGEHFDDKFVKVRKSMLGSTMTPEALRLKERLDLSVANNVGPLSFRVATYINNHIEATSPDLLGALMINHGEQINLGKKGAYL